MKKLYIFLVCFYMIIIFVLSSIPDYNNTETFNLFYLLSPNLQNLLHIPEYSILSILLFLLFKYYFPFYKAVILSIGISILYSIMDEIHQIFVIGRVCSITDLYLDFIGILLGISVFIISKSGYILLKKRH